MVDYDSQRHNFQSLQCNLKKKDEIKVSRGKELLEEAKRTYEQLNSELHDELPALYDSRVLFLVTNLQTLFAAEQVFHAESAKVGIWTSNKKKKREKEICNSFFFFFSFLHLLKHFNQSLIKSWKLIIPNEFSVDLTDTCQSFPFFLFFLIFLLFFSLQVYSELEAIVDKLANESQRGSYTLKKTTEPQSPKSPNANSTYVVYRTNMMLKLIDINNWYILLIYINMLTYIINANARLHFSLIINTQPSQNNISAGKNQILVWLYNYTLYACWIYVSWERQCVLLIYHCMF